MNQQIVASLARHLLTAVAGGFFLKYGVDGGAAEAIIGGASALAGVGWSIYDKKKGE
jgi:O-antigen/teichoic acid export membrane protein